MHAPEQLGRGIIVQGDALVPEGWSTAAEVVVDSDVLADASGVVPVLHSAWAARRPIVVRLYVDPATFRRPESVVEEPWRLGARHELWVDRLHFLVWANNYDARAGELVWWWATKAARLGEARLADDGDRARGDIVFADGSYAWVDGGPRGTVPGGVGPVVHSDSIEVERLTLVRAPTVPPSGLAADQLAAVTRLGASSRIIAPAGSGKTRVLTERLRYILGECGYERSGVLAVAYNVRARDELVQRTEAFSPRVLTLNGLGYDVLATAARFANQSTPQVLGERDVRRILDALAPARRQRRANTDPIAPYIEALGTVRLALRDPVDVEAERDDVPGLAELFGRYRSVLVERNVVDFDEQIYRSIELLLHNGELRRRLQLRCRHVLVDEFQDLTPAHVLLLRLLAGPGLDVFGVGDDDQVIYGHAGASPSFLVEFDTLFPGAEHVALETNYRCPVAVVRAADTLLRWNRTRVDKAILARPDAPTDDDRLRVVEAAGDTLMTTLTSTITGWLSEGAKPADIAVLTRVNASLLAPAVALSEAGVGVNTKVDAEVLNRLGTRAALAYLRLGCNPKELDRDDLAEVYKRPSRGLPDWITKWFRGSMSIESLLAIADRLEDDKIGMKVTDLASDIATVTAVIQRRGTTREALAAIRTQVGLGDAMEQLDRSKAGNGGTSQLDDLEALEQLADLHPNPATFEHWLRKVLGRPADPSGVLLATVHKVKGQEWPNVVIVGANDGLMPHRLADDLEEERRVLHVGITRCSERVLVLADESRPSPFVAQLHTAPSAASLARDGAAARVIRSSATPPTAKKAKAAGVEGTVTLDASSVALLDALKAWRGSVARAASVPPYVVFHDRVLVEVAQRRPADERELSRIGGVGPAKLEKYAAAVLDLVRDTPPST